MSNIESVSHENRAFPPSAAVTAQANVKRADFDAMNAKAERDIEGFWGDLARETLAWHKPFTRVLDESNAPFYRWFDDGKLNASYNCLDRNLEKGNGDKLAIIFERGRRRGHPCHLSRALSRVCRLANGLKSLGVKKGDRVIIYIPMSIEGVAAMQACARIGATHSVVFGGFSAKSLQERIIDAGATAIITADEQVRGGRALPIKAIVDEAIGMGGCEAIRNVVVYRRTGNAVGHAGGSRHLDARAGREAGRHLRAGMGRRRASAVHPVHVGLDRQAEGRAALDRRLPAVGDAHDEVGVRHQAGGRVLVHGRHRLGHRPHLHRVRSARDRHHRGRVRGRADLSECRTLLGDHPEAQGDGVLHGAHGDPLADQGREADANVHPKRYDLSSLRLLGTVGEPINPEAWMWYHTNIGGGRCPIVDTFWQTETGGHMITPLPGVTSTKPGSCTLPLPGIVAAIVDEAGHDVPTGRAGCSSSSAPGPR